MRFCIAGHSESGSSNLALRLSRLYPMHDFEARLRMKPGT